MTSNEQKHPFLDDLADHSELRSSILRAPITGESTIRKVVDAVGAQYVSQTPTFYGAVDGRHFLQYQATLRNGRQIEAVGVVERDDMGVVSRVTMTFSPLDALISLSAGVSQILGSEELSGAFL